MGPKKGQKDQRDEHRPRRDRDDRPPRKERGPRQDSGVPMLHYRIEVGHQDGVKPGEIVGAIANEAGLEGRYIGRIDIQDDHSLVDLPEGMPKEISQILRRTRVRGKALKLREVGGKPQHPKKNRPHKS